MSFGRCTGTDLSYTRTLFRYLHENPRAYAIVGVSGALVGALELIGITSLLPAVAILLGEEASGVPSGLIEVLTRVDPYVVVSAYLGLILLQASLVFLAEAYFMHVMARWRTTLSLRYITSILNADFPSVSRLRQGEPEVIITRNIGYAVRLRHRTAIFVSDILLSLFYFVTAAFISWYTFILFLLLGSIYAGFNRLLLRRRVRHSETARDRYYAAAQLVSEHFYDMRGLSFANRDTFKDHVGHELDIAAVSQRTNDQINIGLRVSVQPILLVLLVGGVLVAKLALDAANSEILLMLFVFYRSAPRITNVSRGYGEIIQDSPVDVTPDIERWKLEERRAPASPTLDAPLEPIELADVHFAFDGRPVLSGVNMRMESGQLVALVGASGSGKSTLLDLVCGFRRPDQGTVRVGGLDPSSLSYDAWLRRYVSLLGPGSTLVTGTIASNVAFLEEAVDAGRVAELVELVGLEDIVGPQGIRTPIMGAGHNLSAGQSQRLLLARALYKRPNLLILDEPTSNLDRLTEQRINDLVASLKGKMTIVVVSHRGEILTKADCVYRLQEGSVQIEGPADHRRAAYAPVPEPEVEA